MFSGMIRKFSMLSLPFCVTIKVPVPSVADPGCLSRIPDPNFYPSRIPNLGSRIQKQQQKTGVKNFFVKPIFVATNFTKLNIFTFLISWIKKIDPIFQELLKFLPKKLSPSPQKYEFGIRDPEKTYSGSRIQGSKRHRIPDPDPQHCRYLYAMLRIRDVYPGSSFFPIPDPWYELSPSQIRIKELKYFNPKNPGCSSRIWMLTFYPSRILDQDVDLDLEHWF